MKTEKEKAKELVDKFTISQHLIAANNIEDAKLRAMICVEEIKKECHFLGTADYRKPYWQKVNEEIEKL